MRLRTFFWKKFNSEQLLLETFSDALRIFSSVQPKSCRTILHTRTLIPLCLIMLPSTCPMVTVLLSSVYIRSSI